MTSLLEKAISVIAPHRCIICSNYNNVVCTACTHKLRNIDVPFCVLCAQPNSDWRLCSSCAPRAALTGVYVGTTYQGLMAELIQRYKFDHARAACQPIATTIAGVIPYVAEDWAIVAVPTVPLHVRQRGYDHAWLIAKEVARQQRLPVLRALRRVRDTQQKGASRQARLHQARHSFAVRAAVTGKKFLVVDDVCTTGATLLAAAHVLKAAGATEVWGAVAAWQPPVQQKTA